MGKEQRAQNIGIYGYGSGNEHYGYRSEMEMGTNQRT